MGKKVKPKTRNPRKVQSRALAGSVPPDSDPSDLLEESGDNVEKDRVHCSHYSKDNAKLNQILCGLISSSHAPACEDCREEPPARRGGKEKGKQQKKKGGAKKAQEKSDSNYFWVCLDCNCHFCGGAVDQMVPYGHARRHSKQAHHPLAVRFDDPSIGWCFSCDLQVQVELPIMADREEETNLKRNDKGAENGVTLFSSEGLKGYVVRGLSNLGNTCFFNSVMQNLLAIDMFRDYMINLDKTVGPLTVALKKLFVETSGGADTRGVLSPKNLFGCICSKAPQFRGYQQQDSHELLRCLLDGLHVEETHAGKSHGSYTLVDIIFGGQLSSTICCVECGHTSIVHEPFLDLSLPVPSKKTYSKKVPSSSPKRSKPPLKERNKNRRFREKGTAKGSTVLEPSGVGKSANSHSQCSNFVPPSKPEEIIDSKEDEPSIGNLHVSIPKAEDSNTSDTDWWMDYLADPVTVDAMNTDAQSCDSFPQSSTNNEISQRESGMQPAFEPQNDDFSMEAMELIDSSEEASSRKDAPCSSILSSGVILLPYEELNPISKGMSSATLCSQNQETMSFTNEPITESNVLPSYVPSTEQAEAEFDGFGDLFNEPEVTSEPRTESGVAEEMTLWVSNSSESNQEEVDNTNAPVSINSCLALFTKPELLSDEHAWYCDNCSGVLSRQTAAIQNTKKSLARPDNSEEINAQVSGGQERSSQDLLVCFPHSKDFDAVDIADSKITSTDTDSHAEMSNISNSVSESENTKEEFGEASEEKNLQLQGSMFCVQTCSTKVMLEEQEFEGTVSDKTTVGESQDVNCSLCDKESLKLNGQVSASIYTSQQGPHLASMSNSCKPDDLEANHAHKKGKKHVRPVKGSRVEKDELESKKVKRDATKRILINRTPHVLTIHMKRFSQDARGRLTKLNGHVGFQEMLDLKPYLDSRCEEKDRCTYRLIGVVEHSGSMGGGHYVAYVRGEKHGTKIQKGVNSPSWFYISDAHVRETSLPEVLQSEAYILFYEKV